MRKITFERTFAGLRFCVLQLATMLLTTEVSSSSARRRWAWEEWEWVLINFTIRPVTGLQKNEKAWIIYIYLKKKPLFQYLLIVSTSRTHLLHPLRAQEIHDPACNISNIIIHIKKHFRLSLWFNFLYLKIKFLLHWNNQRIIKPF